MPQEADAVGGFLTWLTEAATWLLGSEGVLLALLGLLIILGFRRDRLIANYKALVTAEARLAAQHPDDPSRVADILRLRRIPDRPWGWWRRRMSDRCFLRRLRHYRMVLLIGGCADGPDVVIIWEAARNLRQVTNRVLANYGQEAAPLDAPLEDDDEYTVVPLEGNSYLIIEPAGWRWRLRRTRQQRPTVE